GVGAADRWCRNGARVWCRRRPGHARRCERNRTDVAVVQRVRRAEDATGVRVASSAGPANVTRSPTLITPPFTIVPKTPPPQSGFMASRRPGSASSMRSHGRVSPRISITHSPMRTSWSRLFASGTPVIIRFAHRLDGSRSPPVSRISRCHTSSSMIVTCRRPFWLALPTMPRFSTSVASATGSIGPSRMRLIQIARRTPDGSVFIMSSMAVVNGALRAPQPVEELLANLCNLRRDHERTVRLARVALVAAEVLLLRRVAGAQRHCLRDDRGLPRSVRAQPGDRGACRFRLHVVVVQDDRAVLRSDVVALPVQRGRIMNREEDVEQIVVRDALRVVGDLHHFRVARVARAYGPV